MVKIFDRAVIAPRQLGAVRSEVGERLRAARCEPAHIAATALVLTELLTNAFLHGASPHHVTVEADGAGTTVRVRDAAARLPTLRPPGRSGGGYGLRIVQSLTSAWGVTPEASGKQVWATVPSEAESPPQELACAAEGPADGPGAVVRLHGALDADAVGEAEPRLDRALEGASARLDIEVGDVPYVTSAGVRLLLQLSERARAAGVHVRVVGAGPVVRQVLALVGLDRVMRIEPTHD